MKIYSQNKEQVQLLKYFGDYVGTFCDIGANDGETLSNTRAMALLGWFGVCIEPTKTAFEKLDKLYENSIKVYTANFAIAGYNGRAIIHENGPHLSVNDSGLLSTLKADELGRWAGEEFKQSEVPCYTFDTMRSFMPWEFNFDFISIDAEGMDFEILQQIDLTEVKAVCIEHNGNETLYNAISAYCNGYGLKTNLLTNLENVIWVR